VHGSCSALLLADDDGCGWPDEGVVGDEGEDGVDDWPTRGWDGSTGTAAGSVSDGCAP
jgi:hypothetical protein